MDPRLDSLPAIEDALWQALQRAVHDKTHPWRTPVLATTDGEIGDARTVVLREAERGSATLRLYSDARSAKAAQIAAHPHGTLVMWSPVLGWQLRMRALLSVSTEGLDGLSVGARTRHAAASRTGRSRRAHALRTRRRASAVDRLARAARRRPPPRAIRGRRHAVLVATVAR
jgi:pyridoxamine 5'-phosphate oxidase